MIRNILVASAEGLRSRTRLDAYCSLRSEWCTKPGFLRRAQFYLLDHTHPFSSQDGPASRRKVLASKI
jgi:hypothetical protein